MNTASGTCLCGGVSFTVRLPSKWVAHCHCTRCRRAHGAAFVTWVGVAADEAVIHDTSGTLRWFGQPPGGERGFCSRCGSPMFFRSGRWPGELHVARALFATPLDREPQAHAYYDTHVPWVHLADDLPKTTTAPVFPLEGGCDCRQVRYRLRTAPLVVHCCHCRWCQRESGSAFVLNAVIEADRVVAAGEPELVDTPSASGLGQQIARCPRCRVALWSHYAGAGPLLKFVRVGTLDTPDVLPPDIHIFTSSRQPWVVLPAGAPAVPEYYRREDYWPDASIARFERLMPAIRAWQAAREEEQR